MKKKKTVAKAPNDHEARLKVFYEEHNPEKIVLIPHILDKYKGKEDVLFRKLKRQYSSEGTPPWEMLVTFTKSTTPRSCPPSI